MARAGFYAVESGKISFRKDGNWYSDEERIDNARIAMLFSQSIRQNPDGSFFLQVAEERASISVEDTPYVIRSVEDDGRGGFAMLLNDGTREALDPATLAIGAENVLYSSVKKGQYRARFLRPAYYHLSGNFEADASGRFLIQIGGKRYPLNSASSEHSEAHH
jgi:uncharacterized protein